MTTRREIHESVVVLRASKVPSSVSKMQAIMALRAAGRLGQVIAAVSTSSQQVQDAWAYSSVLHRDSPTLAALAVSLDMTSAEVDALFVSASQINV